MYENLFFYSENKDGFFFSSDFCSASGRENEAVYYSVTCSGEGMEHFTGYFMFEITEMGPRGRGSLICPFKTRKFWRKTPVEIASKHSLFLMTPTETITADLWGISRPDF